MKFTKNNRGFTLIEIVIGLALCGVVAFGTSSVIKLFMTNTKKAGAGLSRLTIEKMFEQHLLSRKGCQTLIGFSIDSGAGFVVGPYEFSEGSEIGEYVVESVKLVDFSPTDETLKRGLTKVTLTLKKGEELMRKVVPVAVNVTEEMRVDSCFQSEEILQEEIIRKVCSDTYGIASSGKTCEEAARGMKNYLVEDICKDLNQGDGDAYENGICNLRMIHAKQACEEGKVASGFDYDGKILCNNATLSPPIDQCAKWGEWLPYDTDVCEGESIVQTRKCEDGKLVLKQSREIEGSTTCSIDCSIWYRGRVDTVEGKSNLNGSWSNFKSGDVGDCNNPPLCGIQMGLSCVGNIRARLNYMFISADQESYEVISPWSSKEGDLVWGGWASTFTPDTFECNETKKCGFKVRADTSHPKFKCQVKYQYKNDRTVSGESSDGTWAVIMGDKETKEANCDEGAGCGMRATIECKKK